MRALDAPHYLLTVRLVREYEDTEHYQITRRFLTDHRGMLKRLLE